MTGVEWTGSRYRDNGECEFRVWAPCAGQVEVHLLSPEDRLIPLQAEGGGYYHGAAQGVSPFSRYLLRLDGDREFPDPASRFQPEGLEGPSAVIPSQFPWEDQGWTGLALKDYLFYELHVGTFTPEGTFEAILPRLDELRRLGITTVELMPVAQFAGKRNWGYDGVFPYAVQHSYGGPEALKRLVNRCHKSNLAVVLDVVYNHLGPQAQFFSCFGPYFSSHRHTPWGPALNFDGPGSRAVRDFLIGNILFWIAEYHLDGFRLDAVDVIADTSETHFLKELSRTVQEQARSLGRPVYLFAESIQNNPAMLEPFSKGGWSLDAVWNDDFHHALHALLTGERQGYYQDFGEFQQLLKAFQQGFVFTGQFSRYWKRRRGRPAVRLSPACFVVYAQNHDQVGNRAGSERLSRLVCFEALKLAAAAVLLSPFLPLLFMGEEYGETSPFPYFVDHSEPALNRAAREGRIREFSRFDWPSTPPDPAEPGTFAEARLRFETRQQGHHQILWRYYQELIRLRKWIRGAAGEDRPQVDGCSQTQLLWIHRREPFPSFTLYHFGRRSKTVPLPLSSGRWRTVLASAARKWGGPVEPQEFWEVEEGAEMELTPYAAWLWVKEQS